LQEIRKSVKIEERKVARNLLLADFLPLRGASSAVTQTH
jgi:hypothetical protein